MSTQYLSSEHYISMLLQLDHLSWNWMAEFVTTHREGISLHYQGYIYVKIRDGKEGITFWRCKSGCLARASSEGSSVIVRREHDHPPNSAMCTKERMMSMMRKCAREESTSINRIYDDALQVSNSVMYTIAKH